MTWITLFVVIGLLAVFFVIRQMSLISPDSARGYLKEGAIVVDVRSPSEYDSGHLRGTVNLPMVELSARIGKVCPDKNRFILLHCLSGGRSGMAVGILKSLGYAKAYNLGSYSRAEGILAGAQGK